MNSPTFIPERQTLALERAMDLVQRLRLKGYSSASYQLCDCVTFDKSLNVLVPSIHKARVLGGLGEAMPGDPGCHLRSPCSHCGEPHT